MLHTCSISAKREFITDEGLAHGLEGITDIALAMDMSIDACRAMHKEFDMYKEGAFDPESDIVINNPGKFWRDITAVATLRTVAVRMMNLKSSSANVERLFSTLKNIQSPKRNRLSYELLEKLAKIKVFRASAKSLEDDSRTSLHDLLSPSPSQSSLPSESPSTSYISSPAPSASTSLMSDDLEEDFFETGESDSSFHGDDEGDIDIDLDDEVEGDEFNLENVSESSEYKTFTQLLNFNLKRATQGERSSSESSTDRRQEREMLMAAYRKS